MNEFFGKYYNGKKIYRMNNKEHKMNSCVWKIRRKNRENSNEEKKQREIERWSKR